MGLPHFRNIGSVYSVPALCEICNEAGNHYGYGRDRVSEYSEVHDFCSEHAEEYKEIYKKKIRKIKLEKIKECQKSS